MENRIYDWLMEKRNPLEGFMETRLFALMLSFRATSAHWSLAAMLGLTDTEMISILTQYFPTAVTDDKPPACFKIHWHAAVKTPFLCYCCGQAVTAGKAVKRIDIPLFPGYPTALNRQMEVDDLKTLLLSHRSSGSAETNWFAAIIAVGALGENHLWQDLGLSGREDVSFILKTYFAPLFYKNSGNMKWKKFFYKQLCDMEEIMVCKAPSCSICCQYAHCFGPEYAERKAG